MARGSRSGRIGGHVERRRGERAGAAHAPDAEQPPEQPGKFGIARHRRHLVLPEIDEAPGKLVEIGLGHGPEV
jgi:hypothetical protein